MMNDCTFFHIHIFKHFSDALVHLLYHLYSRLLQIGLKAFILVVLLLYFEPFSVSVFFACKGIIKRSHRAWVDTPQKVTY